MELFNLVKRLANHLSQLDQEESSRVESLSNSVSDVQDRLASHLVDQFWSCVLRNSTHCLLARQPRNKDSRYSASRILEDLEFDARKKATKASSHVVTHSCSREGADNDVPIQFKKIYQERGAYVDVALKLHKQVMYQKGLHLESLALTVLLQLYQHISHIPGVEDIDKYVPPAERRWLDFTCGDEVLEMLCHSSAEPTSCIASLELSRHVLSRKGVKGVRYIEVKMILDNMDTTPLVKDEAMRWAPSTRGDISGLAVDHTYSQRWTSTAFERALSEIPLIKPPKEVSVSTELDLESLTISPPNPLDRANAAIHSSWLSARHKCNINEKDITLPSYRSVSDDIIGIKERGDWLPSHLMPPGLDLTTQIITPPQEKKSDQNGYKEHAKESNLSIKTFKESYCHVMNDIYRVTPLCHISSAGAKDATKYNAWQILPSFDNSYMAGNITSNNGMTIQYASIIEAMNGFTVKCLFKYHDKVGDAAKHSDIDWFLPTILCLQGFESNLFNAKALCQHKEDASAVRPEIKKWLHLDNKGQMYSMKNFANAVWEDFMARSADVESSSPQVMISTDGRFLQIPSVLLPSVNSDIRALTDMECTEEMKKLRGYKSLKIYIDDICHVGSVIRRLKFFVNIIRCLENDKSHRDIIGSTLSVYVKSVEVLICDFEKDVSTFGERDLQGKLCETMSVFSLALRCVRRWATVISWLDDVTFAAEYNSEGNELFMLPRGSFFLDCMLTKYAGSFSLFGERCSQGEAMIYQCVMGTMKPYLNVLSQWISGYGCHEEPSSEFHRDNDIAILSSLRLLEGIILESREFSLFLRNNYQVIFSEDCFTSMYPHGNDGNHRGMESPVKVNSGAVKSFGVIMRELSEELYSHHTRLNSRMVEVLRTRYPIFEVMNDIYSFVLLSRPDLMGSVLQQWSNGRSSNAFLRLFTSSIVEAKVKSCTPFKHCVVNFSFSMETFNSYLFTEDIVEYYNAIFHQLCMVHFSVMNVLNVSKWLLFNFRGPCVIGNKKCKDTMVLLQLLVGEMQGVVCNVEWYMRHIVLSSLYHTFMRKIKHSKGLTEVLEHHLSFVISAANMCFVTEECGRLGTLLKNICYCTEIISNSISSLGFNVLNSDEQAEAFILLKSTLHDLRSKFQGIKGEFMYIIDTSRDPGSSHLATILSNTVCVNV